jgi:hypothetical protein
MPRVGSTYSLPAGSIVTDGVDQILASQHNTPLQDIAADLNAARPVAAGGTGATTAADARTNLGIDVAIATKMNASGSAPLFAVRAWCSFDGTAGSPTVAAGGNVASITKNATGDYTITFTTAMQDANYAVHALGAEAVGGGNWRCFPVIVSRTTAAVRVKWENVANDTDADPSICTIMVVR